MSTCPGKCLRALLLHQSEVCNIVWSEAVLAQRLQRLASGVIVMLGRPHRLVRKGDKANGQTPLPAQKRAAASRPVVEAQNSQGCQLTPA